jgi:hypothetical protein
VTEQLLAILVVMSKTTALASDVDQMQLVTVVSANVIKATRHFSRVIMPEFVNSMHVD